MSKLNKFLLAGLATTVAVSVVPAVSSANTENVEPGVYFAELGKFYTFEEFNTLSENEIFELMSGDPTKVFLNLEGMGVVTLSDTTGKSEDEFADAAINSTLEVPNGEYTKVDGETVVVGDETPEENLNETFFYNLAA